MRAARLQADGTCKLDHMVPVRQVFAGSVVMETLRRQSCQICCIHWARLEPKEDRWPLDLDVCRWDHVVLGISARSHVAATRRALDG